MEIDGEIIFFPLGGSNLALWTSRLENLNRPEFHLFDRDTTPPGKPKYKDSIDEINTRDYCKAICTNKRELENYIHIDAINKAYLENNIDLKLSNKFGDFADVPEEIAKIVHNISSQNNWDTDLNNDDRDKKSSKVKKILNRDAVKYMTKKLLDEVDTDNEVIKWFTEIKQLIK